MLRLFVNTRQSKTGEKFDILDFLQQARNLVLNMARYILYELADGAALMRFNLSLFL